MSISGFLDEATRVPRAFSALEVRRQASPRAIEAAIVRGDLVRVLPGRYASTLHADSWSVRSLAACAWMPAGGALTGRGALFEQGYADDEPGFVDLVVPRGCHRRGPSWMRVVSQTHPFESTVMPSGVTVAHPALALVHAFVREPVRSRATLVYGACAGGRIDPGEVRLLVERLPRVPARRELERLLDHAADGVESFLEEKGASKVLTGAAFERLVRQHRLRVGRTTFRVDAYDPMTRTALEFDGAAWHSKPDDRERDLRRDALLSTMGVMTLRFGYRDVTRRPGWCRQVALRALAVRAG